ncbi:hypothetical protein CgunFtcFv8_020695 [Champsocephalus gunnari]|uniref:Uncharacterized protein n=2 Tax=Channichthyidae TaxID=30806 RepID=A0AAN8E576_CHAGU|nr:hypothetical protein KUCAC02_001997 [Chaenocephalus aceratus]KAK5935326.1 hypothetical protein CgunFtcFv8_020695 [Champsocephalus gunnari]
MPSLIKAERAADGRACQPLCYRLSSGHSPPSMTPASLCQAPLSEDYRSTGHPSVRCTPAFCQTGSDRPLPLGRPQRPI